jgi:peptidoglycan-associated lipoprotein
MHKRARIAANAQGTLRQIVHAAMGPVVLFLCAVLLAGCPKNPEVGQAGPAAVGPQAAVAPSAPTAPAAKAPETPVSRPGVPQEAAVTPRKSEGAPPGPPRAVGESPLKDVFFEYDKATIREDQKAALAADVAWLRANPAGKLVAEGHCDERGTAEYNLALGERRAKAVRDFLVAAGIEASRIRTVSYGEERPFVLGHDESAWKFNRRGHLVQE